MAIHTFSDKQPRTTTICVNYQTKCSSSIREDDIFFEGCEHHLYYFIVFIANVSHFSIYFLKISKNIFWEEYMTGEGSKWETFINWNSKKRDSAKSFILLKSLWHSEWHFYQVNGKVFNGIRKITFFHMLHCSVVEYFWSL